MSNNLLRLFLSALVVMSTLGCTRTFTSAPTPSIAGLETGFRADVELGPMVSGTATAQQVLFFVVGPTKMKGDFNAGLSGSSLYDRAKGGAVFNALAEGGDILIAPRFEIVERRGPISKTVTAKVVGFRGTLKGVKKNEGEGN